MTDTATKPGRDSLKARLEAEYGKPLQAVIVDAINRNGNVTAAAAELKANRASIVYWMYRYHIHVQTRAYCEV